MIQYAVVPLSYLMDEWKDEKLKQCLNQFHCIKETDLEVFLQNKSLNYERDGIGKTFLIVEKEPVNDINALKIIAYFTLALTAIDLSNVSTKQKKRIAGNYPNRDKLSTFPAYLIGQFGRNDAYTATQLDGQTMMNEICHTLEQSHKIVGCKLVVLECREGMFEKVYQKLHFKKMDDKPNANGLYMLYCRFDFSI